MAINYYIGVILNFGVIIGENSTANRKEITNTWKTV